MTFKKSRCRFPLIDWTSGSGGYYAWARLQTYFKNTTGWVVFFFFLKLHATEKTTADPIFKCVSGGGFFRGLAALCGSHIGILPKNLALDEIPNDKHLPGLWAVYSSFSSNSRRTHYSSWRTTLVPLWKRSLLLKGSVYSFQYITATGSRFCNAGFLIASFNQYQLINTVLSYLIYLTWDDCLYEVKSCL